AALRPVTPAQQAEADLARIKAEKLPYPGGGTDSTGRKRYRGAACTPMITGPDLVQGAERQTPAPEAAGRKIDAMDAFSTRW
ncbi:CarD-like/TRCF domain protein, partial [Faecalibacterium prausnitzii]